MNLRDKFWGRIYTLSKLSNFDHFWAEFLAKDRKPRFCENIAVCDFSFSEILLRFQSQFSSVWTP